MFCRQLKELLGSLILTLGIFLAPSSAMAAGCQDLVSQNQEQGAPALLRVTAGPQYAQNETVLGLWTADQDPSNATGIHCHFLNINEQTGPNRYTAILDTTFRGGESRQSCDITIISDAVSINCEFVSATALYIDDNFTLTLHGDRMTGLNEDDAGVTGQVDFCKART